MRRIHWLLAVLVLLIIHYLGAVYTAPWGGQRAAIPSTERCPECGTVTPPDAERKPIK